MSALPTQLRNRLEAAVKQARRTGEAAAKVALERLTVVALLMMLAFLVDQVQQLCCPLFQAAWHKMKTKCHLWEELRHHFRLLLFGSMAELLTALIRGIAPQNPIFGDTS